MTTSFGADAPRRTVTATGEERRPFPFTRFASAVAIAAGRPSAFALACVVVVVWAVTGPIFHWSDTWQLVINTGTTIITFLMVFIIQNAQNRDGSAIQLKLDELIRATRDARDRLVGIEHQDEAVVERLEKEILTSVRAAKHREERDDDR